MAARSRLRHLLLAIGLAAVCMPAAVVGFDALRASMCAPVAPPSCP